MKIKLFNLQNALERMGESRKSDVMGVSKLRRSGGKMLML